MRKSAGIFGFVAVTLSVILEVFYGTWRLYIHFGFFPLWAYRVAMIVGVVFVFSMFAIVFRFQNAFVRALGIFASYLSVFAPFLTFFLGITHLLLLIWDISVLWSGVATLSVTFIVVAIGAVLGNTCIVRQTKITLPKLKEGLTVVQISDAHIGVLYSKRYLAKIVEKTNRCNPDFVVITGDLTETKAVLNKGVLSPLSNLKAPTFFVEGNHESYAGLESVLQIIREQKVQVLRNQVVQTHGIQLVGIDYMKADEQAYDIHSVKKNDNTIKSVLAEIQLDPNLPAILLSHNPTGENYAADCGIDLMLSGHTHKGQVFPFSIITKMAYQFHGGLYDSGKIKVFVSAGAGGVVARMRLGSFNEINLLKLTP